MFPVQRGLISHRSTINQFAKPGYPFMSMDPFPYTAAPYTTVSNETSTTNTASSPTDASTNMNNQPNTSPVSQFPSTEDLLDMDLNNKESSPSNGANNASKKPLSKAERRAEHNAIERARRENLNIKFQTLAQALPNLINYRRPSKSQIVEKALDWVKQSIAREERYRYQILQLQRENKRLLAQLMQQQPQQDAQMPTTSSPTQQQSTHQNHQQQQLPHNPQVQSNGTSPVDITLDQMPSNTVNINAAAAAAAGMTNIAQPHPSMTSSNATNAAHAMTTPPMTTTMSNNVAMNAAPNLTGPLFYNNSSNASLPNLYSSSNHAWSSSETHLVTPQMTPYSSTEELSKQEFGGLKSDDEETSSGMEDDIEFQTSPMNGPYFDANAHNRQTHQALMATELYPVGLQNADTHFDPNLMNSWNNMKYATTPAAMMNGGHMNSNNIDAVIYTR